MQTTRTCTHIKVTGVRCGSPALRGQSFCYFHQRMHRGVRTPPQARLHPIALIEDGESIQMALMEVINALMRNTIDLKRATLMLRALHIAVKNASRAHFDIHSTDMVKEVPDYQENELTRADSGLRDLEIPFEAAYGPDPRASKVYRNPKTAEQIARDRAETIANYYGYPTAEAYEAAKKAKEETNVARPPSPANPAPSKSPEIPPNHVGTDPLVRPAGPEVSVRSAVLSSTTPAAPAHDFKNPTHTPHIKNSATAAHNATPRKPPMSAKHLNGPVTPSAPKERKIAAHTLP